RFFFIENLLALPGRRDSHNRWISFRGAGHGGKKVLPARGGFTANNPLFVTKSGLFAANMYRFVADLNVFGPDGGGFAGKNETDFLRTRTRFCEFRTDSGRGDGIMRRCGHVGWGLGPTPFPLISS
ncbi:MAG TPA: hypothetical protein VNT79_03015, partial [Phycisphaerae bacterium]|nr:hypothetical protein [Phycisphaerae bacterium]